MNSSRKHDSGLHGMPDESNHLDEANRGDNTSVVKRNGSLTTHGRRIDDSGDHAHHSPPHRVVTVSNTPLWPPSPRPAQMYPPTVALNETRTSSVVTDKPDSAIGMFYLAIR